MLAISPCVFAATCLRPNGWAIQLGSSKASQKSSRFAVMIYVIGSGPAAIAAIMACVEQQQEVTVLDVGYTPESPFAQYAIHPKTHRDFPLKTTHGSDYPYWHTQAHSYQEYNPSAILSSHAKGGFSSVWGAGLFPWAEEEFDNWPVSYDAFIPWYEKLSSFLPMAAAQDHLAEKFPLFHHHPTQLNASTQFEALNNHISKHPQVLSANGIVIGQSRLAVDQRSQPCVYCGQCIDGCPHELIYSTAHTMNKLIQTSQVHYQPGIKVEKLNQNEGLVEIEAWDLAKQTAIRIEAEKVFLGCGALQTTLIMMRSLGLYDQVVKLKDSQYFLFPILGPASTGILHEDLFTLSQAFLEIINKEILPFRVHVSLYGYSSFLKDFVYGKFGFLSGAISPLLNWGLKRTFIGQSYLPSSHSNKISVTMKKGDKDKISIQPVHSRNVKKDIQIVLKYLNRFSRQTGLRCISPLLNIAPVGKSFHLGASFPMQAKPDSVLETNSLGESPALPHVHLIDSSILPDIQSGPITYTMMANAYRIAFSVLEN